MHYLVDYPTNELEKSELRYYSSSSPIANSSLNSLFIYISVDSTFRIGVFVEKCVQMSSGDVSYR